MTEYYSGYNNGQSVYGYIITGVIILIVVWMLQGSGKYEGESAEYWFNAYDEASARADDLESKIEDYQTALEEANSNIEDANSMISNIESSSDIYELRDAIESLHQVDTVYDPE